MGFIKSNTGTPVTVACCACDKALTCGEGGNAWADTDGEAFKAYYCESCKCEAQGFSPCQAFVSAGLGVGTNFITPSVEAFLDAHRGNAHLAAELSTGRGMDGQPIFGLTMVVSDTAGSRRPTPDYSRVCFSKSQRARRYYRVEALFRAGRIR